ncbi:Mu transposase C-terminal domain-containing protein [Aeromonas veronii]
MKVVSFHTGLHLTLNSVPYRIDRILAEGDCYLERLSDGALLLKSKPELVGLLSSGELVLQRLGAGNKKESTPTESQASRARVDLLRLSGVERTEVLRKYEYIKAAIRCRGRNPTSTGLNAAITEIVKSIDDSAPPHPKTLYGWWRTWLDSGQDLMSLAPKGNRSSPRSKFSKEVMGELHTLVERLWFSREKLPIQAVYDAFRHRINELNAERLKPLKIPSRAQFYRIVDQIDKYDAMAAREGKRAADKHFRATGAGAVTHHILERVEVDHTPLDVIVINERTGLADGRPTLTLLLCRHSRMVLGFSIGFEPPSELSVMRALRHAILSKAYVKEHYPDICYEWPAYGIPHTLICDNGLEFHSHQLRRVCAELNIELQFCPKQQPHYKGAVERFLGTLNRAVCHRIPGTTFSNIVHRGDYNSADMARITLADLKSLIHEWVIDIYHQEVHRTTHRTPTAMWKDGLGMVEPMLPESLMQLNLILTKETTRRLSHQGVQVYHLFYNSAELGLLRIRSNARYDVSVRYDPEDMGAVWVYDELQGDYIHVPCTNPDYAEGLTLRQHDQILKETKQRGLDEQDEEALLESKARFLQKIEDLSRNKLTRERKKAARDAMPVPPSWSSNPALERPKESDTTAESLFEPLNFKVVTRGQSDD